MISLGSGGKCAAPGADRGGMVVPLPQPPLPPQWLFMACYLGAATQQLHHEYAAAWASAPLSSASSLPVEPQPCASTCSSSPATTREDTPCAMAVAPGMPVLSLVSALHQAAHQQAAAGLVQQAHGFFCASGAPVSSEDDEATSRPSPARLCGSGEAAARQAHGVPNSSAGRRTGSAWQRPADDRQRRLRVACHVARWLRARGLDVQLGGEAELNRAVRRLEALLYVSASSCDEYCNQHSVEQRVRRLVAMNRGRAI